MDEKSYVPRPLNTSDVDIPAHLHDVMEQLAENAHDAWAAQRMSDGWRYGPRRDGDNKEHPCLVCYEQLPEDEKEYDRSAVRQTIAGILSLGYQIIPTAQEHHGSR